MDRDLAVGDLSAQRANRAEMVNVMETGKARHGDDPTAILGQHRSETRITIGTEEQKH
jgi:hypothetical protein